MTVPIPRRVGELPVCPKRGLPVPWFVAWPEGRSGEPDFRVADGHKFVRAVRDDRCWVCGQRRGSSKRGSKARGGKSVAFNTGALATVTRCHGEPPSHIACALYAAQACPFLARPHMRRSVAELPEGTQETAEGPGFHRDENPSVAVVWVTRSWRAFSEPCADGSPGVLFRLGEPEAVHWFCEGRPATHLEAVEALARVVPFAELVENAADGVKADRLKLAVIAAMALVPGVVPGVEPQVEGET